ncbi:ribonuclease HII [Pararhizobium sp. IMCC21322]|uniref:ribonuclease HII n=1 Tax=Pararhizobium sp. IMCC21322 TaxID=3067903 RepID=UPI002740C9A2|nr:ribonuclease HII [Pararhizobium sp. IMCC21322]
MAHISFFILRQSGFFNTVARMMMRLFDSPYRAPAGRLISAKPDMAIESIACCQLLSFKRNGAAFSLPLFKDLPKEDLEAAPKLFSIAGVDEAGRGPLAGPVVTAAVILNPAHIPDALNDSKKLSANQREVLFESLITSHDIAIASATPQRIDDINIRAATLWAMVQAVKALPRQPDGVLIDGRDVPDGLPCPGGAVIKGDGLSQSIAAASIIAKVMRDRMMQNCGRDAPGYGLETHMGYGTEQHRAAITAKGGTRHHRTSFRPLRDL